MITDISNCEQFNSLQFSILEDFKLLEFRIQYCGTNFVWA